MGLTGRYDFTGIQKAMERLIDALLAGTAWGVWLIASPFKPVITAVEGLAINWLTNRGLIVINVGDVLLNGKVSQVKLDSALNAAFDKLKLGSDKVTPEEGAKIDADTTKAFDEFADIPMADSVPNLPSDTF